MRPKGEPRWLEAPRSELPREERLRTLRKLNQAEAFERFLHTKYLGHKRFGLEGAESLIPLLDTVLNAAAEGGMDEVVIGMAHRGRLNVLANIIGKSYSRIFGEFEVRSNVRSQHVRQERRGNAFAHDVGDHCEGGSG